MEARLFKEALFVSKLQWSKWLGQVSEVVNYPRSWDNPTLNEYSTCSHFTSPLKEGHWTLPIYEIFQMRVLSGPINLRAQSSTLATDPCKLCEVVPCGVKSPSPRLTLAGRKWRFLHSQANEPHFFIYKIGLWVPTSRIRKRIKWAPGE